ncbi:hypothetical protein SCARD494_06076 [Seiridium cardinale]
MILNRNCLRKKQPRVVGAMSIYCLGRNASFHIWTDLQQNICKRPRKPVLGADLGHVNHGRLLVRKSEALVKTARCRYEMVQLANHGPQLSRSLLSVHQGVRALSRHQCDLPEQPHAEAVFIIGDPRESIVGRVQLSLAHVTPPTTCSDSACSVLGLGQILHSSDFLQQDRDFLPHEIGWVTGFVHPIGIQPNLLSHLAFGINRRIGQLPDEPQTGSSFGHDLRKLPQHQSSASPTHLSILATHDVQRSESIRSELRRALSAFSIPISSTYITSAQKLSAVIAISFAFFVAEIAIGFKTGSLALVADAFHYLNDLIGFVVALAAILVTQRATSPKDFSFGWARASLLGAFFNGVFLLALGVSIFLQSIERFVSIQRVEDPRLVLIMGCIGFTLNVLSAALLGHEHHGHDHGHGHGHNHTHSDHIHDHSHNNNPTDDPELAQEEGLSHSHGILHDHVQTATDVEHSHRPTNIEMGTISTESTDQIPMTPISAHANHRHNIAKLSSSGRDLGMMGALIHVIGDALNNIGVIIAALVIMLTKYEGRFYADPGVSLGISMMILLSSIPLVRNSGKILMQSAPRGVDFDDVKHDLERIPGIESVHELHIWRLDQKKSIASAHVVVSEDDMSSFMDNAKTIKECLHAYGIHSDESHAPETMVFSS